VPVQIKYFIIFYFYYYIIILLYYYIMKINMNFTSSNSNTAQIQQNNYSNIPTGTSFFNMSSIMTLKTTSCRSCGK